MIIIAASAIAVCRCAQPLPRHCCLPLLSGTQGRAVLDARWHRGVRRVGCVDVVLLVFFTPCLVMWGFGCDGILEFSFIPPTKNCLERFLSHFWSGPAGGGVS